MRQRRPSGSLVPLRVLHLYRTYRSETFGGIEESIRQICLNTQAHGIDSTILAMTRVGAIGVERAPEGRIVRLRSRAAPLGCDMAGLGVFRVCRQLARSVDVIHLHFPWPFADALVQSLGRQRPPIVLTYHSDVLNKGWAGAMYRPAARRLLRRVDAVVATSSAYRDRSPVLSDYRAAPDGKPVRVIPLGISEASSGAARLEAEAIDTAARFQVPQRPFLLFLGGLRAYKGLPTLMVALRGTQLPVVIAGDGDKGLANDLAELAATHETVQSLGPVSDAEKMALLRDCAGLVLPSDQPAEAFGLVLLEAALWARPAITCEIGTGTSWVNQHGKTGYVVPPGDPVALREAMQSLLTHSDRARVMGEAARRRYERLFNGDALGAAYADLYRTLAAVMMAPI